MLSSITPSLKASMSLKATPSDSDTLIFITIRNGSRKKASSHR